MHFESPDLSDIISPTVWPRRLNPHYEEVKTVSVAWIRSFGAFSPEPNRPTIPASDLMNTIFVFDEHSDVSSPDEVQAMADAMMDALRNPHKPRPECERVGGEVTRQFWELAVGKASAGAKKRFAVVQQAADSNNRYIRTVDEYLEVRRETIGIEYSLALLEFDVDVSDEVHDHPVLKELSILCCDMILLDNDIMSYNVEQSRGDDEHNNIVTVVMHHYRTDIQGAMDWVQQYYAAKLEARFVHLYENELPTFGEPRVVRYVDGLANWVRGANNQWNFESERYFGKMGSQIFERRWVTLLPKEKRGGAWS
ncbi:isoprenoid synthase domain-containing protein [Vararia minispora EC-137]|uniref:Isoprenoid synthase domain-containing protein n=1 Tax=Vararia minispora EC-137 TaxID=1314806 RepID=A0ACB8Q5A7_9AGAM|nr:isoprenoid synthase domain-containing protein [Vararia minispora EC-137]